MSKYTWYCTVQVLGQRGNLLKTSVSTVKHLSDHSMHGCYITRLRLLLYIAEERTVVSLYLQHSISSYCNVPIIGVNIISEHLSSKTHKSTAPPHLTLQEPTSYSTYVHVLLSVYQLILILLWTFFENLFSLSHMKNILTFRLFLLHTSKKRLSSNKKIAKKINILPHSPTFFSRRILFLKAHQATIYAVFRFIHQLLSYFDG